MNKRFWQQFPPIPGLHCVPLKDQMQAQVAKETRKATPAALAGYFHEAAQRFRNVAHHTYAVTPGSSPLTARESAAANASNYSSNSISSLSAPLLVEKQGKGKRKSHHEDHEE